MGLSQGFIEPLEATALHIVQETIEAFIDADLRDQVKFMVGGAPVTPEFAEDMDADSYGDNAVECVEVAKRLIKELEAEKQE